MLCEIFHLLNSFHVVCRRLFLPSIRLHHRPPLIDSPSVHRNQQAASPPPRPATVGGTRLSNFSAPIRVPLRLPLSQLPATHRQNGAQSRFVFAFFLFSSMPSPEAPGGGRFGGGHARVVPPRCRIGSHSLNILHHGVHLHPVPETSLRCLVYWYCRPERGRTGRASLDCQGLGPPLFWAPWMTWQGGYPSSANPLVPVNPLPAKWSTSVRYRGVAPPDHRRQRNKTPPPPLLLGPSPPVISPPDHFFGLPSAFWAPIFGAHIWRRGGVDPSLPQHSSHPDTAVAFRCTRCTCNTYLLLTTTHMLYSPLLHIPVFWRE